MKKYVFLCVLSAMAGAILTQLWPTDDPESATTLVADGAAADEMSRDATGSSVTGSAAESQSHEVRRPELDEALTTEERVNIRVYEKTNRAVVNISTRVVKPDPMMMFSVPSEGAGSGFVIDKQGHILTNYHVVEGAREVDVTLFDGSTYEAAPVGLDPNTDMAVIKIDAPATSLHPVEFGDSSALRVGQRVFAIGNPFGLERTLTVGIVSSLNRSIRSRNNRTIHSIIQTDAAINPGNSGGPLLDSSGRLIGMNTAIASRTGQSAGVGFAIPVSAVSRIAPQLIADGRVSRASIGITRVMETDVGLVIASLDREGPAATAGLQGFSLRRQRRRTRFGVEEVVTIDRSTADIIVAVDGQRITSADQFLQLIESHQPGDEVSLSVVRDNRRVDVPVTLDAAE
ncbi:MAG: PDZ domain-containing protein [Planctomycetota bacterium]|nr:MAG: PDZ domain-containing protein [Planctomycetota bacterium]REJ91068.1 MAG: PDZ domain-containing protein [Planctomycetota bacterium]REK22197.1 MAG: PDZ domain-containing protein [Planctomycetota bacterium]REK44281.1 MAG: PDZ domain-containing protein [Planctomycetota bacterium]